MIGNLVSFGESIDNDVIIIKRPLPDGETRYEWGGMGISEMIAKTPNAKYIFNNQIFPNTSLRIHQQNNILIDCANNPNITAMVGSETADVINLNLNQDVTWDYNVMGPTFANYPGNIKNSKIYFRITSNLRNIIANLLGTLDNTIEIHCINTSFNGIEMFPYMTNTSRITGGSFISHVTHPSANAHWLTYIDNSNRMNQIIGGIFICIANLKSKSIGAHSNVMTLLGEPIHIPSFTFTFQGKEYSKMADKYTYNGAEFYRVYDVDDT
jgi:hypothetical protein